MEQVSLHTEEDVPLVKLITVWQVCGYIISHLPIISSLHPELQAILAEICPVLCP